MLSTEEYCRVCNSTTFEDIEGEYFCTVCQTQLEGFVAQETDEEQLLGMRLKGVAPKRTRSKHPPIDTGINWTTYEAFNLILVEHLRVLTTVCGLPDMLRKVVLTIWTLYLERSEVALVDGNTGDPKLSATIRRRDVAILSRKVNRIPQPHFKDKSVRDELGIKKRIRYGTFSVVKKRAMELDDYGPDENARTCNTHKKYKSKMDKLDPEIKFELFGARSKHVIIDSSSDSDSNPSQVDMDTDSDGNNLRAVEEDDDFEDESSQSEGEEYNYFDKKVPFSQLNSFSKLMTKLMGKEYKNKENYAGSKTHVDYMDMMKLISMIYLGLRILDINSVHLSTLLKWIDEGILPFNKGINCLPKDWIRVVTDVNSFGMYQVSPAIRNILPTSCLLHSFLKLPPLPDVDMMKLVADQIYHLNLPSGLLDLMATDERFVDYLTKSGRSKKGELFLRNFELTAFSVICVLLRKLFGLQNSSKFRQQLKKEEYFNFKDWESHSRLKLFMITNHIIPTFRQDFKDFNNLDAINAFYEMTIKEWRRRDIAHMSDNQYFEDQNHIDMHNLIKDFSDNINLNHESGIEIKSQSSQKSIDDPTIEEIKPSKYLLIESVEKLIVNQSDSNPVKLRLQEDYRNKSVEYFKRDSEFIHEYKDMVLGTLYRDHSSGKFVRSASVDVLIMIGMMAFRLEFRDLLRGVGMAERNIFHCHNPSTRIFNPHNVKRRKRGWI